MTGVQSRNLPLWRILFHGHHGEDPEWADRIHACDAEEAARRWARDYDKGDLKRLDSRGITVLVWLEGSDPSEARRYVLRGEPLTHYSAEALDTEDDPQWNRVPPSKGGRYWIWVDHPDGSWVRLVTLSVTPAERTLWEGDWRCPFQEKDVKFWREAEGDIPDPPEEYGGQRDKLVSEVALEDPGELEEREWVLYRTSGRRVSRSDLYGLLDDLTRELSQLEQTTEPIEAARLVVPETWSNIHLTMARLGSTLKEQGRESNDPSGRRNK
jgi:hypothetical protein